MDSICKKQKYNNAFVKILIIIVDLECSLNPINNRLYHPSFAAKGLPVDSCLCMLKGKSNFSKLTI